MRDKELAARAKKKNEPVRVREYGVPITNEVAGLCEESHTAAQEARAKASTRLFPDTGIMAVVCCHDHVLWLVNLTTAGERKYFMMVLIDKLVKELPKNFTLGFMYDIACQMHAYMSKVRV